MKTLFFSILTLAIFDALPKITRIKIQSHSIKQLLSITSTQQQTPKPYIVLNGVRMAHSTNKANSNFQYIPYMTMKNYFEIESHSVLCVQWHQYTNANGIMCVHLQRLISM